MADISNKALQYSLTVAEKRILEVCLNPAMQGETVNNKVSAAKTCRDTYYKAMHKTEFVALLNVMSIKF